jgi:hypothetical protein
MCISFNHPSCALFTVLIKIRFGVCWKARFRSSLGVGIAAVAAEVAAAAAAAVVVAAAVSLVWRFRE